MKAPGSPLRALCREELEAPAVPVRAGEAVFPRLPESTLLILDAGGKPSTWFPPGMTRRAPITRQPRKLKESEVFSSDFFTELFLKIHSFSKFQ